MANVLIVEDSKSAAAAHAYSLWEFGHTVTFAYSAKEAKESFQAANHEVVLLDFDLPDGTGLEVFRAIRQVDPTVSVVMVTGKGNECLAAQILKEGAKEYLPKSSELLSILPDVVDRVLKEKEIQHQLEEKDQALKKAHVLLEQKAAELADIHEKLQNAAKELGLFRSQTCKWQKMTSIGQLAAGIAHEINNPTGFISSNLYTLSGYLKEMRHFFTVVNRLCDQLQCEDTAKQMPPAVQQMCASLVELKKESELTFIFEDSLSLIKESRDGAECIKNIVADLKNFAHPDKENPESIDINGNIESTLNLVWHEIKYKAKILKEFSQLPPVRCYPQLISQIFVNLLINAAHAIEKDGLITIRTRTEEGWVIIEIKDTGKGISEELLPKIFDPFFTTKEVGSAMGLGLKVVSDIIHKHNGRIQVKSIRGTGTEFEIRLPINAEIQADA